MSASDQRFLCAILSSASSLLLDPENNKHNFMQFLKPAQPRSRGGFACRSSLPSFLNLFTILSPSFGLSTPCTNFTALHTSHSHSFHFRSQVLQVKVFYLCRVVDGLASRQERRVCKSQSSVLRSNSNFTTVCHKHLVVVVVAAHRQKGNESHKSRSEYFPEIPNQKTWRR